ncbi:MAG: cyclic nucleotide-binding domain-containing protein [Candidatus Aureabacteria bacterium]|nr:cyclic nucleotide-binding domain-containing protein [Candidatus Auribacterota bacterium]
MNLDKVIGHALLAGLSGRSLEAVCANLKEKRFRMGVEIVREGEPGDAVYFIAEGSAEVWKKDEFLKNLKPKRIALLRTGDTFGEMALIDREPRSASVRAVEETAVMSLSRDDFDALSVSDPKTYAVVVSNLARAISRRLRTMDARFVDALFSLERSEVSKGH